MKVNNKEKFIKYIFIYRSILFKFTKFETDINDKDLKIIIDGLNIKNRYKRIYYVIDKTCDYIDEYYKDKNLCNFKNCTCECYRKKKLNYINGCCRKCRFQSNKGCTTKNVACKLFYCTYAKKDIDILKYKDINIIKLLNPIQRYMLETDYFETIEDVTIELYFGLIIAPIIKIIKHIFFRKRKQKYMLK